jgi:hypothetical protein
LGYRPHGLEFREQCKPEPSRAHAKGFAVASQNWLSPASPNSEASSSVRHEGPALGEALIQSATTTAMGLRNVADTERIETDGDLGPVRGDGMQP